MPGGYTQRALHFTASCCHKMCVCVGGGANRKKNGKEKTCIEYKNAQTGEWKQTNKIYFAASLIQTSKKDNVDPKVVLMCLKLNSV